MLVAGRLACGIDANCVGVSDMRARMEQTFPQRDRCLKAAGATWAVVVTTNTYVNDFVAFQKGADGRKGHVGGATPASMTDGIRRLARGDLMIEIEAAAVVNQRTGFDATSL